MSVFNLPSAVIVRIVKNALPDNESINSEVKTMFNRAAACFILYLVSTADKVRQRTKRATISTEDVLIALHELCLGGNLASSVAEYINKLRDANLERRKAKKGDDEDGAEPKAKKPRTSKSEKKASDDASGEVAEAPAPATKEDAAVADVASTDAQ